METYNNLCDGRAEANYMAETKVKADKKNTAKKTAKKRITKKEKQKNLYRNFLGKVSNLITMSSIGCSQNTLIIMY